jgi:hypothetical protein
MLGVENSHALNDKSCFQEHLKRLVSERCSGNAGDDFVVASEKLNCCGVAEPCGLFPCPGVASIFVELDRRSHRFIYEPLYGLIGSGMAECSKVDLRLR